MRIAVGLLCATIAGLSSAADGPPLASVLWLAAGIIWILGNNWHERKALTMVKRYHAANPDTVARIDFELEVWRDGVAEVHTFTAQPMTDAGAMIEFSRSGDDGERKAKAVFRMMSKMLVNNDGVPAQWSPRVVERPKNAGADYMPKFRAPLAPAGDGKLHPMSEADKWTDPARGSSRRRWDHLMFEDTDVTVDIGVISEILSDLAGEAAELPTNG